MQKVKIWLYIVLNLNSNNLFTNRNMILIEVWIKIKIFFVYNNCNLKSILVYVIQIHNYSNVI